MKQIEVIMLQPWKPRLKEACLKLGTVDVVDSAHPTYVYAYTTTKLTATEFEDRLREELKFDGFMEVSQIHEDEYTWPDYTRGDSI